MKHLSPYREGKWPHLLSEGYEVTSEETDPRNKKVIPYNCIAFAAGDQTRWWWPDQAGAAYWPIPRREVTLDCFIEAYQTREYEVCTSGNVEPGLEKIVIYMLNGEPTHAARQLDNGLWTSKLGPWEDIRHNTTKAVEEYIYGKAIQYMKRPIK